MLKPPIEETLDGVEGVGLGVADVIQEGVLVGVAVGVQVEDPLGVFEGVELNVVDGITVTVVLGVAVNVSVSVNVFVGGAAHSGLDTATK
jgi:hypothetical protein